jgi:ATP-dependent Clp protease ATP-binding subunit ClpA
MFSPEFRNRLDAVIHFAGLSPEIVSLVVDKFIIELEAQLIDRDVTIELDDASREWLAKKGYDKLYGARPLARTIQEHVKKPLAEELLFGKLVNGGRIVLRVEDDKLAFEFIENEKPRKGRKPKSKGGQGDGKASELVE